MTENKCFKMYSSSLLHSRTLLFCILTIVFFSGCSSAPKRPPEVFLNRNAASGQLDLGNLAVSKGDYKSAHAFMQEAWRLAVVSDDPVMRIKVMLAQGNAWFNEGNSDKANESWTAALKEAEESQNKTLVSISKIYLARGSLGEGSTGSALSVSERAAIAQKVMEIAQNEIEYVKSNPLYTAFAWKTIGLAKKELGKWVEAEDAIKRAAEIHEKSRYLEDTAYDWYLIASVRSKAGQTNSAIAALQTAISFDRRAENANGLGMNWMAIGIIEEKAGNIEKAEFAYRRSVDIFNAANLTINAADAEKKLLSLTK